MQKQISSLVARGLIAISFLFVASLVQAEPYPFPVPFIAKQHQAITFTNFSGPGSIRIYTVNGERVIEIPVSSADVGVTKSWDTRNSSGQTVASGVYYYIIEGGDEQTRGKLVIVR